MTKKPKIGFDIHGCISAKPELFSALSQSLIKDGWEVHILTGSKETPEIHEELKSYGIWWTHFFSITDHCIAKGVNVWYDEKNTPWMDQNVWERAKGEYCTENKIDLCFDDTVSYFSHFTTPAARFYSKDVPMQINEIKSFILGDK